MGGKCGTYGRQERCVQGFCREAWGKELLGKPRHRWEDNIKMDLKEVGLGGTDCIDLAQDSKRRWALVDEEKKFRVPYNREIRWLAEDLLAPQERLCSMELVNKQTLYYIHRHWLSSECFPVEFKCSQRWLARVLCTRMCSRFGGLCSLRIQETPNLSEGH